MLKLGIVGIGDIARKAYLPITTRLKDVELYVFTRNKNTLKELKKEYPSIHTVSSLNELLTTDIDGVMIHSSTSSHYELIKTFLTENIPVFVDKPISNNIDEVTELFDIAQKRNILLRTGFNRRNTPLISKETNKIPSILIYQKNRTETFNNDIDFIFDDFIHIVDTVRFLMKDRITNLHVKETRNNGLLESLHVFLESKKTSSTLIMHRNSGQTEEIIELLYPNEKVTINDLSEYTSKKDNLTITFPTNSWESTLSKRGFKMMIDTYIDDLKKSKSFDVHDLDSLETHKVCHMILQKLAGKGNEHE